VEVVTLLIAVFGAVTGAASLAWSIASHVLSGGRVAVDLRGGWAGPSNLITAPLARKTIQPDRNFVNEPVLAVQARNTGRLPVSVEGWAVKFGELSLGHVDHYANDPLPRVLNVGESATWIVPLQPLLAAYSAALETGMGAQETLRGTVSLGSGKARTTKPAPVKTSELPEVFGVAR
jgi:hypothetical protein